MEKEIRGYLLVHESEFLDCRKIVIDNIVSNSESFKHGRTEESIQVSKCEENLNGEKDFENIDENFVPNIKDHVFSTSVTKDNEVRVVPNTSLCHLFVSEFHSEEEKKALE